MGLARSAWVALVALGLATGCPAWSTASFAAQDQRSGAADAAPGGEAQDAARPAARNQDQAASEALLVFLDCNRCDFNYLRREITFVNYVRDGEDAQVHVLVSTRQSAAGTEFAFNFIGRESFIGKDDTHYYRSSNTDTEDEIRAGIAQVLRVGFLHYLIDTPAGQQIQIRPGGPNGQRQVTMATPADDPWNFWVYRTSVNVNVSGEESRTNRNFNGQFSANRTTDEWKIRLGTNGRYSERSFELSTGTATDIQRNLGVNGQIVQSWGPHWGVSLRGGVSSSTFVNQDLTLSVAPGIEYNVFPYDESSRRLLTVTYEIGVSAFNYDQETLFERIEETLVDHGVSVTFDARQPWGESRVSFDFSQYLHDASKHRLEVGGFLEFRIIRGLSLNVRGNVERVRDQLFLPREDLTDEEILLQRRQLATGHRYDFSVGVSYTFGSIFNNIVNPRFDRAGGGRFR